MATIGTRAEIWADRLRRLTSGGSFSCVPGDRVACTLGLVSTEFTVYRRTKQGAGARNKLGIQAIPTAQKFVVIGTGQGIYAGTKVLTERWQVDAEGQAQVEMVRLLTEFDLAEGDNVHLAADDKMYLVEASSYAGPLRDCLLNSTKAQAPKP